MEERITNEQERFSKQYKCMKRIVVGGRKSMEEYFPLPEVPTTIVTRVLHKLKNLDRLKMRRTCKAFNTHIEKIGVTLSSRPERDFSLRFSTTSDGSFACDLTEWKILFNYFNEFERKNCYKTVRKIEDLSGLSFASVRIELFSQEHASSLQEILEVLSRLQFGINTIRFKTVPAEFVQKFLAVVSSKEIVFEDNSYSLDILNIPRVQKISKVSFWKMENYHGSLFEAVQHFESFHIRFFDAKKGNTALNGLAQYLSTSRMRFPLSRLHLEIKIEEDITPIDLLSLFQSTTAIFSSAFLEDNLLNCRGCMSDYYTARQCFPTRIDVFENESDKQILLVQNRVYDRRNTFNVYDFYVFDSKNDGLLETVSSSLAGNNWPLDFSGADFKSEELFDKMRSFVKNYMSNVEKPSIRGEKY